METHEIPIQETPFPPSPVGRGLHPAPSIDAAGGVTPALQNPDPAPHRARGAWKERKQRLLATRDSVTGLDLAVQGVFDEESAHLYEDFFKDLRKDLRPRGRMEELCVEQMAISHWRLKRALRAERGYIVFYAQTNEYRRSEHMKSGAKSPSQGDPGFADACRLPNPAHADHVERFRKNAQRDLMRASEMLERLQARRRRLARARVARLREKRERMRREARRGAQMCAQTESKTKRAHGSAPLQETVLTALHEKPQNHPLTPSNGRTNGSGNGEKNFQSNEPKNLVGQVPSPVVFGGNGTDEGVCPTGK